MAKFRMDQSTLLQQWRNGLTILHRAHFESARHCERRNLMLGIPIVILTTIAGTTVFATLESRPELWVKIGIGLLSVIAAVLASLQTFLRYSELSEKHKAAAVRYGALRREVEEVIVHCTDSSPCPREFLQNLRSRWDSLDQDSPTVRQKVYREVAAAVRSRETPVP